jgi:DNA polymerase-3 subunit delta
VPILSDAQLRAALKKGDVAPVYLLVGDDEVGKSPVIEALSNLVPPELQPFNIERLYANEGRIEEAIAEALASARTLPLLGDRRVVFLMRCEVFLKPKRKGAAAEDGEDGESEGAGTQEEDEGPVDWPVLFERYLEKPSPETCLVLVSGDIARNIRISKQVLKAAVVVEFWGLKSAREVDGRGIGSVLRTAEQMVWDRARDAGMTIRPEAIEPILEHAGTDIAVLRNDLDLLVAYCAGRAEITVDDVRAVVGGAVQISEWAVSDAILDGNAREALRQLQLAFDAGQSPYQLLGQLRYSVTAKFAREGAANRLPGAVEAVFRTDLGLKSSGGDPQILLERLVVELCDAIGTARRATSRPGRR